MYYLYLTIKNIQIQKEAKEAEWKELKERTIKFTQQRLDRSQKRKNSRQEVINKNKEKAKSIKEVVNKGLEHIKKLHEQKLAVLKTKQAKEKVEKAITQRMQNNIESRLKKEVERAQANTELLKKLKEQELELTNGLQNTINTSMEVIDQAKETPYPSIYYNKLSKNVKKSKEKYSE